jgi:DNA helicase-2/ATP-dependent DNA helicase PcrA
MTLHSAKGLEFNTVILPGWEEGLFPNQRALDEQGRAGLEEERRLAHVGITRARHRVKIYFATSRRIHGLWQSTVPSRFLDELPEPHVEVTSSHGGWSTTAGPGFEDTGSFGSNYATPGWQRARNRSHGEEGGAGDEPASAAYAVAQPRKNRRPERFSAAGELVVRNGGAASAYAVGDRVFHLKFGYGDVVVVEGNKLTVAFEKAGEKRVVDSFVDRA